MLDQTWFGSKVVLPNKTIVSLQFLGDLERHICESRYQLGMRNNLISFYPSETRMQVGS